jgi:16S rRNA C967 or C1407 C5-methylase (RsmB/RsmF family)
MAVPLAKLRLCEEVCKYLAQWYSVEGLDRILQKLAQPPQLTTIRTNTLKITPQTLCEELNGKFEKEVSYTPAILALHCS